MRRWRSLSGHLGGDARGGPNSLIKRRQRLKISPNIGINLGARVTHRAFLGWRVQAGLGINRAGGAILASAAGEI